MSSDDRVIAAPPVQRRPACPHCGGDDLRTGLAVYDATNAGFVGVRYGRDAFFGLRVSDAEPLFVDLCAGCGTVARLYVKAADREWC
jgi:hypothetical protein